MDISKLKHLQHYMTHLKYNIEYLDEIHKYRNLKSQDKRIYGRTKISGRTKIITGKL